MNAAWDGMFTDETIGICLSAGHKTTKNILATRAFTVSMATVDQVAACDYAGIVSGIKSPTNSPGRDFMPLLRRTSMPR